MSTAHADLTARARLRDAAIECFAARGFAESLRAIAARAGVSAGLVRHHFGSKEQLRAECDATVLNRYRSLKTESMDTAPAQLFAQLPSSREAGILLLYILRSVRDGSAAGRDFIEQMIAEALVLTRNAVKRGLVIPSLDEEARVRFLTYQSIGSLMVQFSIHPDAALDDFQGVMEQFYADIMLPTLELYSDGLFTNREYLEQYLIYREAHPLPHPPAGFAGETASP
ncbi:MULTISPECIES: TetR/AcrR family transcriptional regulator [Arthrobacter]|nr:MULTISPECIES: TetR family transcriptional regulator [Arthrobacter]NYG18578.1 AcrR family transcriptional regulator [Arthrobacter psychrochitiniphilus]